MSDQNQRIVRTIVTSAAIGGFGSLALAGWVLAFDVSSIATMIAGATQKDLLSVSLISGSLTKGVIVGTVFGLAITARSRQAECEAPTMVAAPGLS